jgi:hypothetical protein
MNIKLTWSISKAKDTYGYNRLTALDLETKKKYVTVGSGYDMVGYVIGNLVADKLQNYLGMLTPYYMVTHTNGLQKTNASGAFYGLIFNQLTGKAIIDGACGLSSVIKIVEACGYQLKDGVNKKKRDKRVKSFSTFIELTKQEDQE